MVRFHIDELEIFFPYEFVYPEQYAYMRQLKATLDAKGHGVLEMSTGTGKTVAVMSLITSYQLHHPDLNKFIFCTRTVPEMEKALEELRRVIDYRTEALTADCDDNTDEKVKRLKRGQVLGLGMSARRNLCCHPEVSHQSDRDLIDEKCRALTAPWVRAKVSGVTPEGNRLPAREVDDSEIDIEALFEDVADDNVPPRKKIRCASDCGGKLCPYYENLDRFWSVDDIPRDIYTINDLRRYGATGVNPLWKRIERRLRSTNRASSETDASVGDHCPDLYRGPKFCPYFAARRLVANADVLVLNYQYVLDPKVSQVAMQGCGFFGGSSIKAELFATGRSQTGGLLDKTKTDTKDPSVIVFDEAHNIDNVCIEALSVNISTVTLERCRRNLSKLDELIQEMEQKDKQRLVNEYNKLIRGLTAKNGERDEEDEFFESFLTESFANPLMPQDAALVQKAIPGTIVKAKFFILFMRKVIFFLDQYIRVFEARVEGPLSFLRLFEKETGNNPQDLKFCYERLKSLFTAVQVSGLEEFSPLTLVADFCTLVGTYWEGFVIITDPYPEATGFYDPIIQLCCLDSSLAMKPVLNSFQSLILTSGTISPLSFYPKILNFQPVIMQSFPMSLDRKCICPMVAARGADQISLSSKFDKRADLAVIGNYGKLLVQFAKYIPDGIVCFFTSYAYMETVMAKWYETGVLVQVLKYKLIMMETKDIVSTTLALHNFRKCCDSGRGAIFFSVARGKVAEGVDFDRHYGRAVLLFGVPYQYTLSKVLRARLEYLRERYGVAENEFLSFDAMRQAAQCVGRVIRSKADYGLMVFADYRFGKTDKRSKLPEWISQCMDPAHLGLSVDVAVAVARRFLLSMAQPYTITSKTRLDKAALDRLTQLARKEEKAVSMNDDTLAAGHAPVVGSKATQAEAVVEASEEKPET